MSRRKSGIVNVRMVITEEKILSNIDKIQKIINPNSKKQIVQLEDDTYFKDLIESIKAYLIEYPKKKNFPVSVYKAAYGLVEYTTIQFDENTKKIKDLIKQREKNIGLSVKLKQVLQSVENREKGWKEKVEKISNDFSEEIIDTLKLIGKDKNRKGSNYEDGLKLINARINNLETNLYIEIDMERTEDRSKALSYIGIEVAEALKGIPKPAEIVEHENAVQEQIVEQARDSEPVKVRQNNKSELIDTEETLNDVNQIIEEEFIDYQESVNYDRKPSLWQKIKNSKIGRAISYVMKIRIRVKIELPNALPEGRGE